MQKQDQTKPTQPEPLCPQVTAVDNYQGEENDVIIVSLVRSNRQGSIGFLAVANRINVALSRAQHQLIVVGSSAAFMESKRVKRRARHLIHAIQHIRAAMQAVP